VCTETVFDVFLSYPILSGQVRSGRVGSGDIDSWGVEYVVVGALQCTVLNNRTALQCTTVQNRTVLYCMYSGYTLPPVS
jgi:hypothetical protein